MRQIRKSLFETNSSSTHAVCINKNSDNADYQDQYYIWDFESYCFGRCESHLVESFISKLAYAYCVAKSLSSWKSNEVVKRLGKTIKDFKNIVFEIAEEFYKVPDDDYESHNILTKENLPEIFEKLDKMYKDMDAYVDHVEDFIDNGFYEKLMTDKDFVKRLLFDDASYITVGGDEYRGYNIKTIGFEYDYEYEYNEDYLHMDESKYEKYWDPTDRYIGEFWDKVKDYSKDFEIYFKGN